MCKKPVLRNPCALPSPQLPLHSWSPHGGRAGTLVELTQESGPLHPFFLKARAALHIEKQGFEEGGALKSHSSLLPASSTQGGGDSSPHTQDHN